MNDSESIVRTQVDALKQLLDQSRESTCRSAREQAELQAAEIRRRARAQARERVSKSAHEERARLEREVRMVEAEIETEQRKRARKRDTALIEAGLETLAGALARRWSDPAQRREWAEAAMAEAKIVLLGREWTLEHPAGWPADERDHAVAVARSRCDARVEPVAVPELEIGLRIRSAGALVDMSIPGLMANVRTIEGELLAEFNRVVAGESK